jgi:hypothetical protein
LLRKVAAAGLVLLCFGSPALACVHAYGQLTPAEQACCRRMGPHCGGMKAAQHSCCARLSRPEPAANIADAYRVAPPLLATSSHLPVWQLERAAEFYLPNVRAQEHPPPLIGADPILRI